MKKRIYSFPFFYKLLISYILCGLIPLIIINILLYGFSFRYIKNVMHEQTYNNLTSINNELTLLFNDYENIIKELERDEIIKEVLSKKIKLEENYNDVYEKIYNSMESQKEKPPLHIMDLSGEILISTNSIQTTYKAGIKNNWGIFRKALESEYDTIIYPQKLTYPKGKNSLISMTRKVYDSDNNCLGYIMIDIYRDIITDVFKPYISTIPLEIVMVDEYLYTILDMQNPQMEGKFQNADYLDAIKKNEFKSIFSKMENSYTTVFYKDSVSGITTIASVPSNMFNQLNNVIRIIIIIGCIISLIICCLISILLAKHISNPINELAHLMSKVEKGDFNVRSNFNRKDEIGTLGLYFNHMVVKLKEFLDKSIERQNKLRKTEIRMLQAQINPHFLYNTLDVIKWSAKLGKKDEVTSVVTNLAKILRNSIDSIDEFVTVEKSVEFIRSYLSIQRIKYNDKFNIAINIDSNILDYKIPRLILQPFIENAIVHGISNIDELGLITIIGEKSENNIIFYIIDNGVGMTEDEIKLIPTKTTEKHIGIYNVDKRIKLYYGETYGIEIESEKFKGTKIIIKIPCDSGGNVYE